MKQAHDRAERLLRKAAQDEFTIEKLAPDPAAPDEVIGFHAQQAVEKLLKAVLVARSVRFRRTHDLTELIDLLSENAIPFPPELEGIRYLSPFAAEYRYGDLPEESEQPFDRNWALRCVQQTRAWALSLATS